MIWIVLFLALGAGMLARKKSPVFQTLETLALPTRPPRLYPTWVGEPRRAVLNWPWSVPDPNFAAFDEQKKTRDFSSLMPGDKRTYVFGHSETLYREQYAESRYAITMKKAGWDCMRHYEVMGNGAVPYFLGLEYLPPNTMALFPRELVRALMQLPGIVVNYTDPDEKHSTPKDFKFHQVSAATIDKHVFPSDLYAVLASLLSNYTRQYLTSSAVFRAALLAATGLTDIKSALFIRNLTVEQGNRADYHEMLVIMGMKFALGVHGVDMPPLPLLYDDYPLDRACGWGNCFSYGRRLKHEWKPRIDLSTSNVASMIRRRAFDVIIYGEVARATSVRECMFASDIEAANYEPNRIWLMRGDDSYAFVADAYPPRGTQVDPLGEQFSKAGRWVFYREL